MKLVIFLVFSIYCLSLGAQIVPIPPIENGPHNEDQQGLTKCDEWLRDALKYEEEYVQKSGVVYKNEKSFFKLINKQILDAGLKQVTKRPMGQSPDANCIKKEEVQTLEKIVLVYKDAKTCKSFSKRKTYIDPINQFIKFNE